MNVENPNMGKTTAAHGLQNITMRGLQRWGTKTMISCSLASLTGGYNRGNDLFLSLTLSNSTQLHSVTNIHNFTTTYHSFALSHIYTHMTFGLFTHIAPGGSLEHIHICVPSSRLPLGLQSSGSRPIRRDLFPNSKGFRCG